ncbi:stage III sporulation protein AC [Desulfitispora alkaliphila]|uniref:stage III sporulation protein AC n=1 Tax=Desulfitispora alkaliphila TaxID=622674 RepID=UPI003D1A6A18
MDVDLIFRIAGVGILTAVLHTVLKQAGKDEQGQLVTLAGVSLVLFWVIQLIANLFDQVRYVFQL